jgi:hydrogenase nickel incorporation protein HypB
MNITVLRNIQEANDAAADEIREALRDARVCSINIMGGDGCGKTTLLETLIPQLRRDYRVAVIEGDITTTLDAERIERLGVPIVQLQTDGSCHLDAELVQSGLMSLPIVDCDYVIIENVGNLVCPAEFDIGEHARVAVLSVAEGHDKPAKYPLLFSRADAVIITKTDLIEHVCYNPDTARRYIREVNADAPIFEFSIREKLDPAMLTWFRRQFDHAVVEPPIRHA